MRIIGLDIGSKRTGIAISDKDQIIILRKGTIILDTFNGKEWFCQLQEILKDVWTEIEEVVIGAPFNTDQTTPNAVSNYANQCYRMLKSWTKWQVYWHDEVDTSKWAEEKLKNLGLSIKQREKQIDQTAALKILNDFLLDKKNKSVQICWN